MNIYDRMKEAILTYGWTTGDLRDKNGVCLLGARAVALTNSIDFLDINESEDWYVTEGCEELVSLITDEECTRWRYKPNGRWEDWERVYHFNDQHGRTKEEVITKLEQASRLFNIRHNSEIKDLAGV